MRNIIIISILFIGGAVFWADPELRAIAINMYQQLSDKTSERQILASADAKANPTVTLNSNGAGHFTARGMINGSHVDFLVDTGATIVFISREEARHVGIDLRKLNYDHTALTAAGKTKFARVFLDEVSVGNIKVRNVEAAVAQSDEVTNNLLGMTFLSRIKGFEFSGDRLIMRN
ncbi:MAG: TIGR02281 family clan AA aspartic protease [Hyphomicrobiales bacterium]|nr:MAG: TIGR02281 family clan AA aspartic protease [Hyphomicrobiales bacterium]